MAFNRRATIGRLQRLMLPPAQPRGARAVRPARALASGIAAVALLLLGLYAAAVFKAVL